MKSKTREPFKFCPRRCCTRRPPPEEREKLGEICFERWNQLSKYEKEGFLEIMFPHGRVFVPLGLWSSLWEKIMISAIVYTMVVTPFDVAFITERGSRVGFSLNRCIDVIFLIDIVLSFFRATKIKQQQGGRMWETDHAVIIRQYLFQGRFFIDIFTLAASLFEIAFYVSALARSYKAIRVLRLFRLVRIGDLNRFLMETLRSLHRFGLGFWTGEFIRSMVWLLFVNHLIACAWGYTVMLEQEIYKGQPVILGSNGADISTWMEAFRAARGEANGTVKGIVVDYTDPWPVYIISLYWSTMTLVGYGCADITAQNLAETIVLVALSFVCAGVWSFYGGLVIGAVMGMDETRMEHGKRVDNLRRLCQAIQQTERASSLADAARAREEERERYERGKSKNKSRISLVDNMVDVVDKVAEVAVFKRDFHHDASDFMASTLTHLRIDSEDTTFLLDALSPGLKTAMRLKVVGKHLERMPPFSIERKPITDEQERLKVLLSHAVEQHCFFKQEWVAPPAVAECVMELKEVKCPNFQRSALVSHHLFECFEALLEDGETAWLKRGKASQEQTPPITFLEKGLALRKHKVQCGMWHEDAILKAPGLRDLEVACSVTYASAFTLDPEKLFKTLDGSPELQRFKLWATRLAMHRVLFYAANKRRADKSGALSLATAVQRVCKDVGIKIDSKEDDTSVETETAPSTLTPKHERAPAFTGADAGKLFEMLSSIDSKLNDITERLEKLETRDKKYPNSPHGAFHRAASALLTDWTAPEQGRAFQPKPGAMVGLQPKNLRGSP